jgi:D-threo-aldose 1-dehydrogenase
VAAAIDNASSLLRPGMPRLGFGCGDLFGGKSHAQSARLIQTALDSGIRYFDVARLYGNGSAESVLGSVLRPLRDQVVLVSKAGILPWSMLTWPRLRFKASERIRPFGPIARALVPAAPPPGARFGAFRLADLERSVHRSLKDLRTDYLDVLLLHECSIADARSPEVREFLSRLQRAGKIRTFGIATHFAETCQILSETPQFAPVAQIGSDAFNHHVSKLPPGRAQLIVTHTPLKRVLPRLLAFLATDAAAAASWRERTGLASDDSAGIARLLLADALAQNADGVVLFSSSRPERVAAAVAAVAAIQGLDALREVVQSLASSKSTPVSQFDALPRLDRYSQSR